ncbi:hypothetical protein SGRA_2215 [Saprospira grandis str. Lewin]|uniref:Uncharacterized protein n=1 Tax=Saprospira grandis (strain Lewin) TaxID=984262 RepID=H6L3J6_SAPGL|nr:hypothetical protein SGRA_2215 [Saprospira grandis str. Lewin]
MLRRYASPLAGLLGPAAAFGGFGLALWATAAQRWAAHPLFSLWAFCFQPFGPTASRGGAAAGLGMDRGGPQGQTELFEQSEKSEGPSRLASPGTARPEARRAEGEAPK